MISKIFRPIKEGVFGVGRHAASSLSSASAVTITLIIISIFIIFTANVSQFTTDVEQSVQISVMVDYNYEDQAQEDRIATTIQDIPGVATVTYSSKEDEFNYYVNSFEDEKTKAIFQPFEQDNPMHDAYYVEVENGSTIQDIANQISQIEGVSAINYGGDSAVMLVDALTNVRNGALILVIALSLLAIFLIQNTIKLTIMARADEIAIMRNVGAKNGFIRSPFVIEGLIIGALGAIIPIILTVVGYTYLYNILGGYMISNMFALIPPSPFVVYTSLILLGIGILVGLIGSFISVSKYLRWKR